MIVRDVIRNVIRPVVGKVTDPFGLDSPLNLVKSGPCEFWFDGQDEETIWLFGGTDRVLRWEDKSGFARYVANAVDAQRPTYDPVTGRLTFVNANTTYLVSASFVLAQPTTIYILYKITGALGDGEMVFDSDNAAFRNVFWITGNQFNLYAGTVVADGTTDANDNIHVAEFNGATSNYWINGVLVAGPVNAGTQKLDGITLGANEAQAQNADCEIMEVFGYNCLLTAEERTALDAYLTSKWGL